MKLCELVREVTFESFMAEYTRLYGESWDGFEDILRTSLAKLAEDKGAHHSVPTTVGIRVDEQEAETVGADGSESVCVGMGTERWAALASAQVQFPDCVGALGAVARCLRAMVATTVPTGSTPAW